MKRKFAAIYFLLSLCTHAQKDYVTVEIDRKTCTVGEQVMITVRSNISNNNPIIYPPEFVQGNATMSGLEQSIDYNSGKSKTIYYKSQSGYFKKAGKFTIGPAFSKKKPNVQSNKITVEVGRGSSPSSSYNSISVPQSKTAFGVIETQKDRYYVGEPIHINGAVYSKVYPTNLLDIAPFEFENSSDFQPLDEKTYDQIIDKKMINGQAYLYFNFLHTLLFPSKTGKITFSPFRLVLVDNFERIPVASKPKTIEILPFPAPTPNNYHGLIGEFSISHSVDGSLLKKGDVITLTINIEGTGNMHEMTTPHLTLPKGVSLFGKPSLQSNFTLTDKGDEGKLVIQYFIRLDQSTPPIISPQSFAYFDVKSGKFINYTIDPMSGNGNASQTKASTLKVVRSKNKDSGDAINSISNASQWIVAFIFLLGIGAIFWFMKRKKLQKPLTAKPTEKTIDNQRWRQQILDKMNTAQHAKNLNESERILFEALSYSFKLKASTKVELMSLLYHKDLLLHNELASFNSRFNNSLYGGNFNEDTNEQLLSEAASLLQRISNL